MLTDVVERFMVSGSGDKGAGQHLFRWLKEELRAGTMQGVAETFPRLLIPGLDYTTATSLHRVLKQLRAGGGHAPERRTRIAVMRQGVDQRVRPPSHASPGSFPQEPSQTGAPS
jgi:hypothetical protein